MTSAHVTVEHHDGELVVIAVHGDIDLDNTRVLGEEILRALPSTAVGAVLDLSDVAYLDSAAIRLLFDWRAPRGDTVKRFGSSSPQGP